MEELTTREQLAFDLYKRMITDMEVSNDDADKFAKMAYELADKFLAETNKQRYDRRNTNAQ